MADPCFLLSVGVLICTAFNALDLLSDHTITNDIFDLELRKIVGDKVEVYDVNQWPELRRLWIGDRFYRCRNGYCNEDLGGKDDDDKDNGPENDDKDKHEEEDPNDKGDNNDDDNGQNIILTDVGIILMTLIFILLSLVIAFTCKHLCEKPSIRRLFRRIRRRFRGGITLDGETSVEMSYMSPGSGSSNLSPQGEPNVSPIDGGGLRLKKNLESTRNDCASPDLPSMKKDMPPPKNNALTVKATIHDADTNLKQVKKNLEGMKDFMKKDENYDVDEENKNSIAEGGADIAEIDCDDKNLALRKHDLLQRLQFHPVDIHIKGALGIVQTDETLYGVHCINLEPHGRKYSLDRYPDPETIMQMGPGRSISNPNFKNNDEGISNLNFKNNDEEEL
jgi:hypothetical protein